MRAKHIKKSQVRSKQIKNRSVRASDLAPGVIGTTLQSSAGQARRDAGPTGVAASQNYTTVATLGGLQPGSYVLLAKTNQSSNTRPRDAAGWQAGDDYDDSNRGLRAEGTPEAHSLQLVHAFTGPGHGGAGLPLAGGRMVGRRLEDHRDQGRERQLERRLGLAGGGHTERGGGRRGRPLRS